MVCGGICGQQRTDFIVTDGNPTAHRYINQVLRPVLLPFLQHQPRLLFQQDHARPHTARVVQQFFAENNVNVLPWPVTDRTLWDNLGQRIQRRPTPPMNRDQMVQALRQERRAIPDAAIRRLTNTVRRRVHVCILQHGGHTRYWNMFFVVKFIHLRYEWSYIKSHISPLVLLWTVILSFYGFYWVYSCLFIAKLSYFQHITFTSTCVLLFSIFWKNNWHTLFWSSVYIYMCVCVCVSQMLGFLCTFKHISVLTYYWDSSTLDTLSKNQGCWSFRVILNVLQARVLLHFPTQSEFCNVRF